MELHSFVPWGLFFLEKVLSWNRQGARQGGGSPPPRSVGVLGPQDPGTLRVCRQTLARLHNPTQDKQDNIVTTSRGPNPCLEVQFLGSVS